MKIKYAAVKKDWQEGYGFVAYTSACRCAQWTGVTTGNQISSKIEVFGNLKEEDKVVAVANDEMKEN